MPGMGSRGAVLCSGGSEKHIAELQEVYSAEEAQWNELFSKYSKEYPELAKQYKRIYGASVPASVFDDDFYQFEDNRWQQGIRPT